MNRYFLPAIMSSVVLLFACDPSYARETPNAVGIGANMHSADETEAARPFSDGDMSYCIGYEYGDADAVWQIIANYAPKVGEPGDNIDYVFTPELDLVLKDGIWRGGVGILKDYVSKTDTSDWSDTIYQILLGISLPVSSYYMDITARYSFDDWGTIKDMELNDLDYGVYFKYPF